MLISFTFLSVGQVEMNYGGIDISGIQQDINVGTNGSVYMEVNVKNMSNATMHLRMKRERINEIVEWEDDLCWGVACYSSSDMATNPWTTPDTITKYAIVDPGNSGLMVIHIYAHEPAYGCGIYRYTVIENDVAIDSIDINLCKLANTNEISPNIKAEIFPNPSSNKVTISFDDQEKTVTSLLDISGNVIYTEVAQFLLNIDVSSLPNGVYIIKLERIGLSPIFERIVVKH